MKKLLLVALLAGVGMPVWAKPALQLDIQEGIYDPVTQTTIATSNPFTLRALIDGSLGLDRTFYLSAAIVLNPTSPDFGSFSINGITYSSSSGMQFGTPPVDAGIADLQKHGIFPAWYGDMSFAIIPNQTVGAYNVQDGASSPGTLYYVDFTVDTAGLAGQPDSPFAVHFDLYTYTGHVIDAFAPFSHDAESGRGLVVKPWLVPDGGPTIALLGAAMLGIRAVRTKFV